MAKKKTVKTPVNEPFITTAEVVKVVRTGKPTAQVTVEIPVKDSAIIPIGRVNLTIELAQVEMDFDAGFSGDEEAEGDENDDE